MKKIKLLLLLIVMLIPCMVKADMGAPMTRPYEMVVTAEDGIDYYDYQGNKMGHLNKGDKFSVSYAYDNKYTILVNNSGVKDNEKSFRLSSLEGTMLAVEEITPESIMDEKNNGVSVEKVTKNNGAIVYAPEGVDIRKGPSDVYDKVGHLDKDTTFNYLYSISGGGVTHVYVDIDGVKGWIDILKSKVLLENTSRYIASMDLDLECATIPKNTILTPKYVTDAWTGQALLEKDECTKLWYYRKGLKGLLVMYENETTDEKDLTVYEYAFNDGEKVVTIPANTKYKALAWGVYFDETTKKSSDMRYVNYNGKTGWITTYFDENVTPEEIPEPTTTTTTAAVITPGYIDNRTPLEIILPYVISGLVGVLIVLVIIILVNRKKKNKVEEKTSE